jgi:hypothetical protein
MLCCIKNSLAILHHAFVSVDVMFAMLPCRAMQVASQGQAADDAINRHMDALIKQLAAAEPMAPSPSRPELSAMMAESGSTFGCRPPLWSHLKDLTSAQACLDEMIKMEEIDLMFAWQYLENIQAVQKDQRSQALWGQIQGAREGGKGRAPKAPGWLSVGWDKYHENFWYYAEELLQEEQQQKRREGGVTAAADAAASSPSSSSSRSALQQSVLVLISDDRGFASSIARWVRSGAAGVLLVTTRGSEGWEQPLQRAFGSQKWPRHAVGFTTWDDIINELEPVFAAADGWDSEDEEWGGRGYGGGYELGSYEWMVSEGLL